MDLFCFALSYPIIPRFRTSKYHLAQPSPSAPALWLPVNSCLNRCQSGHVKAPDSHILQIRHPLNVKMLHNNHPKTPVFHPFYVGVRQDFDHPHMGQLGRPISFPIEPLRGESKRTPVFRRPL
jgi:hypothetical protein